MTATDELRRMLDERGVEYETDDTQVSDTEWYYVTKLRDGYHDRWTYEESPSCDLLVSYQYDLGAEDAITATLGKEPDDAAMLKLHDQMNAALLEYVRAMGIEKADGAIDVPFVVEMHRLLEEAATLGSCSCTNGERTR